MDPREYIQGVFDSPGASERTDASRDGRRGRRGLYTPTNDWSPTTDNEHDNLPPVDPARPRRKRSHSQGSSRTPSTLPNRDRFPTDPSAIHSSYPSSFSNAPQQSHSASVNDTGFSRASGTAPSQSDKRSHRFPQGAQVIHPPERPDILPVVASPPTRDQRLYNKPLSAVSRRSRTSQSKPTWLLSPLILNSPTTLFPTSSNFRSFPVSYEHMSSRLADNALRLDTSGSTMFARTGSYSQSRGSSVSPYTQATRGPPIFYQGSMSSCSGTNIPLPHQDAPAWSRDYPYSPASDRHGMAPAPQESGYAEMPHGPHPNSRPNPYHIPFPGERIHSSQQWQQPAAAPPPAFVHIYCTHETCHAAAQHPYQNPMSRERSFFR